MMRLMMRLMTFWPCDEFARKLAAGEFDEASGLVKLAVRWHALLCPPCAKFKGQMEALGRAARRRAHSRKLPPSRLDKILGDAFQ